MRTNSAAGTKWKLPFGLAVLVVAAVVVIPTMAIAGSDAAAPPGNGKP
jgi:hypothetical protein